VARGATIHVLLEGVIDFAKERERMEKELGKLAQDFASIAKKLQNQDFLAKAPAEVVTKVRDQQQELLDRQQKIQSNLDKIREYGS
jgi:valyl-tRNA synthetase